MGQFILYATLFFAGVTFVYSAPVIDAPWGRLSGTDLTVASSSATVYGYLGIPYALPPLGERRFSKPQPHPGPGAGQVFNASTPTPACPQPDENLYQFMSEDCLTLNVYTPAQPSADGRPFNVMVWIHGGGYFQGTALDYTPGIMVTEGGVIVVVIQYRLGILGFMSSGDDVAPGNYGLMDQNLAIKWVKNNIRAFGGDPDSITIFGVSAGAGSVGFQLLSPYSKGLFSRALFQSGSPVASWTLNKNPKEAFYRLANATKCARPSDLTPPQWVQWYARYISRWYLQNWEKQLHQRIVTCLKKIDILEFAPLSSFFDDVAASVSYRSFPWVPVVDGDFVPRSPGELMADPDYLLENGVLTRDILLGVNNNEGFMFVSNIARILQVLPEEEQETVEGVMRALILDQVRYYYGENVNNDKAIGAMGEVVNFFYTQPKVNGEISLQSFSDVVADTSFVVPLVYTARTLGESKAKILEKRPASNLGRTYVYLFDHYPQTDGELQGMDHAADLAYQFDPNEYFKRDAFTADDFAVADSFVSMVTEFAKSGNPNNAIGRQLGGSIWTEFSTARESYLALAPQPRVETDLYAKRVALWVDLLPALVNITYVADHMTHTTWMSQPMGGNMNMNMNTMMWWKQMQHMANYNKYMYINGRMQTCF